jgi:DNA-binding HxlR family transcriptional regulator
VNIEDWEQAERLIAMVVGKGKLRLMAALRDGPLSYTQLAARLDREITGTTFKRARQQLEPDGLIRKVPSAAGRSRTAYELTPAGRALLDVLDQFLPPWLADHADQVNLGHATRRGHRPAGL